MKNYANLIRINRLLRKISTRELEKRTNISHERISKFERNVETPSEKQFDLIMESMDVILKPEADQKLIQLYEQFLDDLFYHTINYDKYLEEIQNNQLAYAACENCQKMLLIQFVCHVLIYADDSKKDIKHIKKLILNENEKQLFYLYTAVDLNHKHIIDEAEVFYQKSFSIANDVRLTALAYYLYSIFSSNINNINKSYICVNKARDLFVQYSNFKRAAYCDMQLGYIYFLDQSYCEALNYYKRALKSFEILQVEKNTIYLLQQNFAWLYICNKEYEKALQVLDELSKEYINEPNLIIYYCICYLKLDDVGNLTKWYHRGLKYIHNDYINEQWLKLSREFIRNPNDKKTLNQAISLYQNIKDKTVYEEMIFVLDIVIELAVKRENYKLAYEFQKEKEIYINGRKTEIFH